jgi:hypothetical protein
MACSTTPPRNLDDGAVLVQVHGQTVLAGYDVPTESVLFD